jgi:hypothetical protein
MFPFTRSYLGLEALHARPLPPADSTSWHDGHRQAKVGMPADRYLARMSEASFALIDDGQAGHDDMVSHRIKALMKKKGHRGLRPDFGLGLSTGPGLDLDAGRAAGRPPADALDYVALDIEGTDWLDERSVSLAWCKADPVLYVCKDRFVSLFHDHSSRAVLHEVGEAVVHVASVSRLHYAVVDQAADVHLRDAAKDVSLRSFRCLDGRPGDASRLAGHPSPARGKDLAVARGNAVAVHDLSRRSSQVLGFDATFAHLDVLDLGFVGDYGLAVLDQLHSLAFWDLRKAGACVCKAEQAGARIAVEAFAVKPHADRHVMLATVHDDLVLYDLAASTAVCAAPLPSKVVDVTWHDRGAATLLHTAPFPGVTEWRHAGGDRLQQVADLLAPHETDAEIVQGRGWPRGGRLAWIGSYQMKEAAAGGLQSLSFLAV